jgi:hypothetical protein
VLERRGQKQRRPLLTYSGYYDVALRDFGLLLAALTLARLASIYDRPSRTR